MYFLTGIRDNRAVYWNGVDWVLGLKHAALYPLLSAIDGARRDATKADRSVTNIATDAQRTPPEYLKSFDNDVKRRKRNPDGGDAVRQASARFEDFRGEAPASVDKVRLSRPAAGLAVGELDGVLYTTTRDGKTESYVHKFRKKSRPLLVSSDDGNSLHIIGGRYEFTERGIVDK